MSTAIDHDNWLARRSEDIIEPALPIIDPHHHLWIRDDAPYLLPELAADLASGHNIVATVFEECHSMYRARGPEALRPVGETEFVAGIAAMSDSGQFGPTRVCAAIVGGLDMTLGAAVEAVLDAHIAAAGGRFRAVRYSTGWDASEKIRAIVPEPHRLADPRVRAAMAVLNAKGLAFDAWLYHTQLADVADLADAFPGMTIVLNHVGSPILGGPYGSRRDAVFADWKAAISEVAARPNVVVKLGALPIRLGGGSHNRDMPPSSEEVATAWRPWIETCIEAFGPHRAMFESNFPVQRRWCAYPVVWNAFKRLAAGSSAGEKSDLFQGTAARAYRITEFLPA
ncbi:MAG: amidohydrolase [Alphaproteobacteria bacterium]|nr:amidohydrolase [Alphaproteobacteria bacterium]